MKSLTKEETVAKFGKPTGMFLKSDDVGRVPGKEVKAAPAKPEVVAVKGVPEVKPVAEVKDEAGVITVKAVQAVKAVKAIKGVPAKAEVKSGQHMAIFAKSEKTAKEAVTRMADQGIFPITGDILQEEDKAVPARCFKVEFFVQPTRQIFLSAFKKVKDKAGYNKAGFDVLAADKKVKAQEVADKAKAKAEEKIAAAKAANPDKEVAKAEKAATDAKADTKPADETKAKPGIKNPFKK